MIEATHAPPAADAELARRVGEGGELGARAEAELCRRLWPRVRLFLGRHLAAIHAVDDVAQEVLIVTLVALREDGLRDAQSVGAFVLGVCRNKVREHARSRTATRAALERLPPPEPVPARTAPVRLGRLEECLSMLRERERTVLRAVFCEGKSSRETGTELGLKPTHVRVVQLRAIAQLRACVRCERFEVER